MSEPDRSSGMSPIVKTVCGWLKAYILLYGIHTIVYGHLTPGGGFAGGVIAAASFGLVLIAEGEGTAQTHFSRRFASVLDCVGVLTFLALACSGLIVAAVFFANYLPTLASSRLSLFSGGLIAPSNLAIGLKVCASMYLVLLVLTITQRTSLAAGQPAEARTTQPRTGEQREDTT